MKDQAAQPPKCEHLWVHHHPAHSLIWIPQCAVCGAFNVDDINGQVRESLSARVTQAETTVTTVEELEALPVHSIVMSAAGTVACRFDETKFVCFGDERPGEPWTILALPVKVLYRPEPSPGTGNEASDGE